jgi:hypothetical protein
MVQQQEEEPSTASNYESHSAEDEPDNDDALDNIRYHIRQHLRT